MVNAMTSRGQLSATLLFSLPAVACVAWLAASTPAVGQGPEAPPGQATAFLHCRTIQNEAARLRCYEDALSTSGAGSAPPEIGTSAWHLVRTPNPEGGREAISVMRTADTSRSDLDLAGLMLRCGDSATEVLFVVVQPFPPRARPRVTLQTGSTITEFLTSIAAPGALVLLPAEANALPEGPWQSAKELRVKIVDGQNSVQGIILLSGLGFALQLLHSSCEPQ